MPYTDTTVNDLIINVLTKDEYDELTPSNDQLYLITDDSSVAAGTGISASTSSGVTTMSLDTTRALSTSDISTGTDTDNKLVSAKTIHDSLSGVTVNISGGTGISTSSSGGTTTVAMDTTYAVTAADISTGTATDNKLVSAKTIHDSLPSVTHGTGISTSTSSNVTTVSLDTTYAVTATDISTGTSTDPKLVSAKVLADAIAGGGGGGGGSVTSVGLSNVSGETDFTITGSPVTSSGTMTIQHANSVTAQSTSAVYPITFDKHGHITAAGTAVTIPPTMTVLSYGSSTWAEAEAAYLSNTVVYCKASSNSNPGTGTQGRMAFLAYVNNPGSSPTEFEFQYYRSVSSHTSSQQGDQVYVYKLNKTNGWSVTIREAYSKILTGAGLTSSYTTGTSASITLKTNLVSETKLTNAATAATEVSGRVYPVALDKNSKLAVNVPWTDNLPAVTASDNGKVLRVVNGAWSAESLPSASGNSF